MSFTSDLLTGLAGVLVTAGVATYRSDGSGYLPGETAITFALLPQQPDRCVTLSFYLASDQPVEALSTFGVQVRCRGNVEAPHDADDLADGVFQALQALSGVQLGTAWLVQILRVSAISMGQDSSVRFERSDNYYADVNTPATAYRN